VSFEVGGLYSDNGVVRSVTLVEAVTGKKFDIIVDISGDLFVDTVILATLDERFPVFFDILGFFLARIAAALNRVHEATPDYADTMTLLELTAGQGTTMGRNFNELYQIIDQVEDPSRVGICVDTCHAFAAGYDISTPDGYEATLEELDSELGLGALKVWHFNDSKGALDSHLDRHTHIGEGEIGEDAFGFILNDARWDSIPMLLETPKEDDLKNDVRNLATLCSLVNDATRIPPGLQD
jgi:deoxyribonuclease-4